MTLWPLPRPWAGSKVEPSSPHEAPPCAAFPLCYSNSLVTNQNPRGSLTGVWGSQAWLLTAPRWKASDAALSPACCRLLRKLLGDLCLENFLWVCHEQLCLALSTFYYCISLYVQWLMCFSHILNSVHGSKNNNALFMCLIINADLYVLRESSAMFTQFWHIM